MLTSLDLSPSFGFGDRLGLATPGHIAAVRGTKFAPIFAQQSVRENARTGRTPQQVMNDAKRAVDAAHWDAPWGADADHLKTLDDLPPFVEAGYTFFTVDPGYVDNSADTDPLDRLRQKIRAFNWEELSALYLHEWRGAGAGLRRVLMRATIIRKAIQHARCSGAFAKDQFDFECRYETTHQRRPRTFLYRQ
jgi:hypothetical protein